MDRRLFLQQGAILSTSLWLPKFSFAQQSFPVVRLAPAKRNFKSKAIEQAILEFKASVADKELGWLFENCFPNTLDTTVTYSLKKGRPDTYVITGDIDAMWLRDSAAQVWPYLHFIKKDKALKDLIAGVINKQTHFILKDPYANAFYNSDTQISEWKNDLTAMKPGIHERKWEIDSLCYPIRLAYHYWKNTNDIAPFDGDWKNAIIATLKVFKEQQRKTGNGPYKFQRTTAWATDGVPLSGYGYPVDPVGLICSIFRPSDDATIYPFLVPSNFFAVVSLKQASEMMSVIFKDTQLAKELKDLATEVEEALHKYAIIDTPNFGKIYAFEINGYGSFNLMDDTNVPSLLSMPYLDAVDVNDPIYQNTRKYVWSQNCPFFYTGKLAQGMGSPHTGADYIWPMSIIVKGLTSQSDEEITACIKTVQKTHASTGFVHESFHKDNPKDFTRKWFAWANTLYGEFLWKIYQEKPHLLK